MESVLDFDKELDVPFLDKVVTSFYHGSGPDHKQAQRVLTQFQEHPDAWTRSDAILEYAQVRETKYLALSILEKLVQTRWKILPRDQALGIRHFIVSLIVKTASDERTIRNEKVYINKLNLVLVEILKQDWPQNWPEFISEIVVSSRSNPFLCENNMVVLKLLRYASNPLALSLTTPAKKSLTSLQRK
jgi:exportin-1